MTEKKGPDETNVVEIIRLEEKFFQIRTEDGGTWGYHRTEYEERPGR